MNACIIVLLSNEFSASGHKFVSSIALFQMVENAQNDVIYVQLLVSGHLKYPTAGFQTTLQKLRTPGAQPRNYSTWLARDARKQLAEVAEEFTPARLGKSKTLPNRRNTGWRPATTAAWNPPAASPENPWHYSEAGSPRHKAQRDRMARRYSAEPKTHPHVTLGLDPALHRRVVAVFELLTHRRSKPISQTWPVRSIKHIIRCKWV